MVFSCNLFLFAFLPLTLAAYFLAPRPARNGVLLAVSLIFYVWGEKEFVAVLLGSIAVNFALGRALERHRSPALLTLGIVLNLAGLVAFKYAGFFTEQANAVRTACELEAWSVPRMHLPVGISFITFQAIAYLIDVYRRDVPSEPLPGRYALYAALFPHLVAGPIVRYRDLADQLPDRPVRLDQFASGVRRFIVGLGKKVLIADTLATTADAAFALPASELAASAAWLGLWAYSLQIYFDFSGYSDMAIGLGRMFGFEFLENFRHPYASASVGEFWRRWHISLSGWLRDYVYIPLGGSRGTAWRTAGNTMAVFFLCGLWHGAAWTFVAWGLWHGALIVIERVWALMNCRLRIANCKLKNGFWFGNLRFAICDLQSVQVLSHVWVWLTVMLGWVWFRAETLGGAVAYFTALCGGGGSARLEAALDVRLALFVGTVLAWPVGEWAAAWLRERRRDGALALGELAGSAVVFTAAVIGLAPGAYQPFLYFRF